MKQSIRSWLEVDNANPVNIRIQEILDYEANAVKNRIWYRGDSSELEQLYSQINLGADRYKFWASKSTPGMEIRKIHTGIPSMIIDTITTVTLADWKDLDFSDRREGELWKAIEAENKFNKKLEKAVKETLYIGDGCFKISLDSRISRLPIIEYYPGERFDIISNRGRIEEITFKTVYYHEKKRYILLEHYGYGYVKYDLTKDNKTVDINTIPQTRGLTDVKFGGYDESAEGARGSFMMAVPIQFFESGKWDERGQSIFDKKVDCFDALDEVWSQWMDAVRAGRAKMYIPEDLIPKNMDNGSLLRPNSFDNRFIKIAGSFAENDKGNKIDVEQPEIPHESYLASYVTALDQCLQGIISPSTLGIDMKKLDNAEAQREKEKATLYTRNAIVQALQKVLPKVADTVIKTCQTLNKEPLSDVEATAEFGEYANPSFESQIETVGKARMQGIMSLEASVEELYGSSKDEKWKEEEVKRLKAEQGILVVEEPALNVEIGGVYAGEGAPGD